MAYGWLGHNEKTCVKAFIQVIRNNNRTGEYGESNFLHYWNAFDKLRVELNDEISKTEDPDSIPVMERIIGLCESALEQYQRIHNAAAQMITTLERSMGDFSIISNRCEETLESLAAQE